MTASLLSTEHCSADTLGTTKCTPKLIKYMPKSKCLMTCLGKTPPHAPSRPSTLRFRMKGRVTSHGRMLRTHPQLAANLAEGLTAQLNSKILN